MEFFSLKTDGVFREVMSYEDIRKQLISDTTGIPFERIRSARLETPYLWRRYRFQKQGILDVAVVLDDGTKIDIEMQVRAQSTWFKRKLFYLAKMYTQNLRVGQDYSRLRKCISISILDFNLIKGEDYHTVYTLRDRAGRELTDLFEIHIVEITKKLKTGEPLNDWIRLFNADTMEDLDMIKTGNAGINRAIEVVREMNLGKELRWLLEAYQKERRDRVAEDEYVREEGRAEGRAQYIVRLLERLGEVPARLRERICAEKDPEILDRLFDAAMKAESIQEFEKEYRDVH